MAAKGPNEWTLNREIASDLTLPPQFLTKILRTLTGAGILLSQRGKAGGFRLARTANAITLLDVVDPFDHMSERRSCLLGQSVCNHEAACPVHAEWIESQDTMLRILETRTIADISAAARPGGFPRRQPPHIRTSSPRRSAASGAGPART
jgi:Rrf2 family protein